MAYNGGSPAELANRHIRRILDIEASNAQLKYLFPHQYRGFSRSESDATPIPVKCRRGRTMSARDDAAGRARPS